MSGGSGKDADAVEAVDRDDLVGTDEVEVLAARWLSALGTPDTEYLDVAAVTDDAIAGPDVTGKGN